MTKEQMEEAIRKAVHDDNEGLTESLFQEYLATFTARGRAVIALRNLDVEIGRLFLNVPPVRWLVRKGWLLPKDKYVV